MICTAMVEEKVPSFMRGEGRGWVTAEYEMLPSSTGSRKSRDRNRGKVDGRTVEIQRLIGRSLRSIVDLKALGERTIWIDCDVIQADGGTRTASITGGYLALEAAVEKLLTSGQLSVNPIIAKVAALSVGKVNNEILLDLEYSEDSSAEVDMNIVMNSKNEFIEIQGTGEESTFTYDELIKFIEVAKKGFEKLFELA